MIANFIQFKTLRRVWIGIILFLSINTYAVNGNSNFRNETDSLKSLVQNCTSDTAKFKILYDYFWQYAVTDLSQVKNIGEWAYDIIKDSKNPRALSDGYDIKAFLVQNEEKFDSAFYYFNKALQISKNVNYKFRMAWSYYQLAFLKNTFNDQQGAVDDMKNALLYFSEIKDYKQDLDGTWFIAHCYQKINYDSAIVYYEKRLKLFEKNPDNKLEILLCLEIAIYYKWHNDIRKSIELVNRSLEVAAKIDNDKELGNIYVTIGDFFLEHKKGNYNVALDYYKKAFAKSEKVSDYLLKSIVCNRIGNFYLKEGKDSLALSYQLISLGISEKLKNQRRIAVAHKGLGYTNKDLGNYQSAINNFKMYLETGSHSFAKIEFHQALIEIADLYFKLNNFGEALTYYRKTMELAEYFKAKNEIALSNLKIGNYYRKINQQLAAKYYLSALKTAEEVKNIELTKSIADTLSQYYMQKNNYRLVSNYQHLSRIMEDSLKISDRYANIADFEMEFEVRKAKKEIESRQLLANEEIKRQKIYRNFFLLITGLLGLLGTFLYVSYRRKKKDNLLLTAQKREILEKNQEIQAQIEEIERISKKLHEADQAKLRFFSNISHEFRTPLTLILGTVEKMIRENQDNCDLISMLNIVQRNSFQLFNLINQLLDIRKLDSGNIKLNVTNGDIAFFVKGLCTTFSHLAEANDINYSFKTTNDKIIGWFDTDIIEKSINNLLSNAFKHTLKHGEITLSISIDTEINNLPDKVSIVVSDNGKGIPEEHIRFVLDRYYQVENNNTGFNTGTGIGLAYTKELIELHKGSIEVESKFGQGASFKIILPVHGNYYSKSETSPEATPEKSFEPDYNQLTYLQQIISQETDNNITDEKLLSSDEDSPIMLIVEDNNDLRTFIKSIFISGFKVLEASDGQQGLQIANEVIPDVIISDIMMPGMDGLELCGKLKSNIHTNHVPILLLTAKTGDDYTLNGLKTGADDYLTKPFNSEILAARIKSLILSRKILQDHFARLFILNPSEVKLPSPDDEFIKKVVGIIDANIENPALDAEMLMKELGVSRTQLFRKIKALTNYTVTQLIRNIRLKRAAQLLQQKSLNITEVLFQSGFNSPSYFTTCFKEMFGCLPKDYAENQ